MRRGKCITGTECVWWNFPHKVDNGRAREGLQSPHQENKNHSRNVFLSKSAAVQSLLGLWLMIWLFPSPVLDETKTSVYNHYSISPRQQTWVSWSNLLSSPSSARTLGPTTNCLIPTSKHDHLQAYLVEWDYSFLNQFEMSYLLFCVCIACDSLISGLVWLEQERSLAEFVHPYEVVISDFIHRRLCVCVCVQYTCPNTTAEEQRMKGTECPHKPMWSTVNTSYWEAHWWNAQECKYISPFRPPGRRGERGERVNVMVTPDLRNTVNVRSHLPTPPELELCKELHNSMSCSRK